MEAAKVSDLVIVPSRATVKDLERVEASIKLATVFAVRPVFVVLTQVRPRGDRDAQDLADALQRGVIVALRVFREQLVRQHGAVGPLGDHVREGAAPPRSIQNCQWLCCVSDIGFRPLAVSGLV